MSDVPITKSVIMFTVNYSHTERIGADIGLADVVAHDDEDVGLASSGGCGAILLSLRFINNG